MVGGVASLVGAALIGSRHGYFDESGNRIKILESTTSVSASDSISKFVLAQ